AEDLGTGVAAGPGGARTGRGERPGGQRGGRFGRREHRAPGRGRELPGADRRGPRQGGCRGDEALRRSAGRPHARREGGGLMAAEVSARLVRELRERPGAGIMDSKRALQETNGDMDAAVTLLREKGLKDFEKRADRATTEGKVGYRLADDGSRGTMV